MVLQQNPDVKGVRASTIRAINKNLWLIDEEFRQNPRNHRLFLEILRAPAGVTHELRRMNTYGVLGRYIPAFGRIVGRMQYDLFHAYTVDAHTLFVLSNLRRLSLPKYDHELPQLSAIMQQLPKLEIAYLAALFHDIAKGRGGDHSQLGAVDAEAFCLEQGLSRYDARLVAWLVQNHLELSVTAQKQDISDPEVINAFARKVGDETHLDYLYVLTSADVRGTNPEAVEFLEGLAVPGVLRTREARAAPRTRKPHRSGRAHARDAGRRAQAAGRRRAHHRAGDHARLGAPHRRRISCGTRPRKWPGTRSCWPIASPAAKTRWSRCRRASERGTTAILAFAPHRYNSFAITTAVLDQLGLNIVDARITPTGDGFSLDLYHVLEEDGAPISDSERIGEIERALWRALQHPDEAPVDGHAPRAAPGAHVPHRRRRSRSRVDERNRRSVLELIAGDRPGLLCDVGKVLMEERVDLLAAKIMTVGERAEDVFYLASLVGRAARRGRGDAAAAEAVRHARPPRRRVNDRLELLAAYPFERLARLKAGVTPPAALPHIAMSIGEPKHAPPAFVIEALRAESRQARQLPGHRGPAGNCARPAPPGSSAASAVRVDAGHHGAAGERHARGAVLLRAGGGEYRRARHGPWWRCRIRSIRSTKARRCSPARSRCSSTPPPSGRFQPDLDARAGRDLEALPGAVPVQPGQSHRRGAVAAISCSTRWSSPRRHDFVIASDECYAELYRDEHAPPPSLLQAALRSGRDRFERCVVFHSLSKRSSVPGLRSGFVAGDPAALKPLPALSHLSWLRHAGPHAARQHRRLERRRACRGEPRAVSREIRARAARSSRRCSTWSNPTARFYLWPDVQRDDEAFTRELFATQNLTILPGSYLARDTPRRQSRQAARAHFAGRVGR